MEFLEKNNKTIFIGQAVNYPGTAMFNTLKDINNKKKIEFPVAEEFQMGFTIGMAMSNYIPITIYPRWNFLLLSINQLINHLDKFNYMYDKKIKVIIRTSIGSKHPLNPQHQHLGDFSSSIKLMSKNLDLIKLREPKDILNSYKKALYRKDGKSTILVEYGDYYNLK